MINDKWNWINPPPPPLKKNSQNRENCLWNFKFWLGEFSFFWNRLRYDKKSLGVISDFHDAWNKIYIAKDIIPDQFSEIIALRK